MIFVTELKEKIEGLVLFIKENVPQLISYRFFFDESQSQMTVVAFHQDSESLEFDTGKEEFRKFSEPLDLKKIDIYGQISDSVRDELHNKVEMLGSGTLEVHDFFDGFSR